MKTLVRFSEVKRWFRKARGADSDNCLDAVRLSVENSILRRENNYLRWMLGEKPQGRENRERV